MKVGNLYTCTYRGNRPLQWENDIILYLGERPVHRNDGVTIINHLIHTQSQGAVVVDESMLPYFEELE